MMTDPAVTEFENSVAKGQVKFFQAKNEKVHFKYKKGQHKQKLYSDREHIFKN